MTEQTTAAYSAGRDRAAFIWGERLADRDPVREALRAWFIRFVFVPVPVKERRPELLTGEAWRRWREFRKQVDLGAGRGEPWSDGIRYEGDRGTGWVGADGSVGLDLWLPGAEVPIRHVMFALKSQLALVADVNPDYPAGVVRVEIGDTADRKIYAGDTLRFPDESRRRMPASREREVAAGDPAAIKTALDTIERATLRDLGFDA